MSPHQVQDSLNYEMFIKKFFQCLASSLLLRLYSAVGWDQWHNDSRSPIKSFWMLQFNSLPKASQTSSFPQVSWARWNVASALNLTDFVWWKILMLPRQIFWMHYRQDDKRSSRGYFSVIEYVRTFVKHASCPFNLFYKLLIKIITVLVTA